MTAVKIDPLSLAILKCHYNGDLSDDDFTTYKLLLDAIPLLRDMTQLAFDATAYCVSDETYEEDTMRIMKAITFLKGLT